MNETLRCLEERRSIRKYTGEQVPEKILEQILQAGMYAVSYTHLFATPDLQKQMLQNEGVEVLWTEDGWRVDLKRDGWKNTIDDALWLREEFDRRNI